MPTLTSIFTRNAQGQQVKDLQTNLTKIGFIVPATETSQSVFGSATTDALRQFQAQK